MSKCYDLDKKNSKNSKKDEKNVNSCSGAVKIIELRLSAVVSMQSIICDLRNTMRKVMHDGLNEVIDGKESLDESTLGHIVPLLSNLDKMPNNQAEKLSHYEKIAELWTEICSEDFFASDASISDVIMVVCEQTGEKFWVCSRQKT